jgi:predicted transcriptional regulator
VEEIFIKNIVICQPGLPVVEIVKAMKNKYLRGNPIFDSENKLVGFG